MLLKWPDKTKNIFFLPESRDDPTSCHFPLLSVGRPRRGGDLRRRPDLGDRQKWKGNRKSTRAPLVPGHLKLHIIECYVLVIVKTVQKLLIDINYVSNGKTCLASNVKQVVAYEIFVTSASYSSFHMKDKFFVVKQLFVTISARQFAWSLLQVLGAERRLDCRSRTCGFRCSQHYHRRKSREGPCILSGLGTSHCRKLKLLSDKSEGYLIHIC